MNVFEKITESPEALASLLRAIPAMLSARRAKCELPRVQMA